MTTKSDFAQKLLTDLRQRKERMAAAQNSSRQYSQTSRVNRGSSGQASRGGRQTNLLDSATTSSRTPFQSKTSRRSNASTIKESSNQIVLYEGSNQSSRQVRDLQMAIAFAFENSGNLTAIGGSSTNPLVNFFNRFGRKSHKMATTTTTTTFYNHRSSNQIPTVSHIHVNEISKGVHKLNQILTACSNGLNLDRNSIEIGRELLKGAINLEESLRMLVSLQDSSEYYTTGSQKKSQSRLKLLDEEEEEEDEQDKKVEQWKLDRPRFSFDRHSSNVQRTPKQKQLALTYDHNSISNLNVAPHKRSDSYVQDFSSSKPGKEKGRISNVVAKLMGLEEIPLKEGNVRESSKHNAPLMRESRESDRSQVRKDLKVQTVEQKPVMKKQQIPTNRVNDSTRKPTHGEDKDLHKRVQNSTMVKAEDRTGNKKQQEVNAGNYIVRNQEHVPKRVDNHEEKTQRAEKQNPVARNQERVPKRADKSEENNQKPEKQNPVARNQEHVHKRADNSEEKKIQKQNPKLKRNAAMIVQKKVPHDKSNKPNMKDPPNRRHQDASVAVDNSEKTAANQESENEQQKEIEKIKGEKTVEVTATQKRDVTRRVQRREIPEKMVTRRNATANHLDRSIKKPANMLKDLKQQMQSKNRGPKRMEEHSDSKAKTVEGKEGIVTEPEHETMIVSNTNVADEFQNQNIQSKLSLNIDSDTAVSNGDVLNDFHTEEQIYVLKDEEKLKKSDQSIETHEEGTEVYLPQQDHTSLNRQEQLTEPEKNLKETVIKSQLFLSTAEALFKLNIPLSFLHATYHQEHESKATKLMLDSAHEVLKRKARRHQVTYHPFMKPTISSTKLRSLDDLIRQLCKDLDVLKSYGMNGTDEGDVAAGLHKMLNRDIYGEVPDVNCMWDLEWSRMRAIFPEMEDVVKDVERHLLNGLLDEIAEEFLIVTFVV